MKLTKGEYISFLEKNGLDVKEIAKIVQNLIDKGVLKEENNDNIQRIKA